VRRLIKHAFNFAFDARHTHSHRHFDRAVRPLTLVAHDSRTQPSRAFKRVDEQSKSAAWDRQPLQHGIQGHAREAQADSSDADDAAS
jgi:hypothetical protein